MESELLKRLVSDPGRWPVYLILALVIIFAVKVINVLAEALAKRLSAKAKEKKGLLAIGKVGAQVVVISLVIYLANAVYWQHNIKRLLPSPVDKPINTCEATVEIRIESEDRDTTYRHFMDSGGYLAFGAGTQPVLVTASGESWGGAVGTNEYISRGVFKMSMTDSAAGKPVSVLRDAKYLQLEFPRLPKEYTLVTGSVVCVVNGEVRFEAGFPPQRAKDGKVHIRDLTGIKEALR